MWLISNFQLWLFWNTGNENLPHWRTTGIVWAFRWVHDDFVGLHNISGNLHMGILDDFEFSTFWPIFSCRTRRRGQDLSLQQRLHTRRKTQSREFVSRISQKVLGFVGSLRAADLSFLWFVHSHSFIHISSKLIDWALYLSHMVCSNAFTCNLLSYSKLQKNDWRWIVFWCTAPAGSIWC